MKLLLTVLFLISTVTESPAQELAGYLPILENQITHLGRGIQDKDSGNIITLGCLGPAENPCSYLQHIFYNPEKAEVSTFGVPLSVDAMIADILSTTQTDPNHVTTQIFNQARRASTSEEKIEVILKKISRDFRREKRSQRSSAALVAPIGTGTLIWGGSVLLVGTTLLPVVVPAFFATCIYLGLRNPLGAQHSTITTELKDDHGWNWSSQPQRISHKNFEIYQQMIESALVSPIK